MFTISVLTFNDKRKDFSIIDRDTAVWYFKSFMQAIDLKQLTMIDGLTGEVIYDYVDKHFTVFNGACIDEKWVR